MQVLTFDGTGGVMRQEALREGTRKKAEASTQRPPQGCVRKEKSHRKRLATVAGVSQVERPMRCPETVAQQFAPLRLVPRHTKAAPKPGAKQLWASLEKPMKTGIEAGFAEGRRRDPEPQAAWIALVDGEPTQIDSIEKAAKAYGVTVVIMLDMMHALE